MYTRHADDGLLLTPRNLNARWARLYNAPVVVDTPQSQPCLIFPAKISAMKRVLVTGGSRGIGRAIAVAAQRSGASVIVGSRTRPDGLSGIEHVTLDVSDPTSVAAAAAAVGPVDVLVNAAGVAVDGLLVRASDADIRRTFDTNLVGAVTTTRAFLKGMLARRSGAVLLVSSVAGIRGSAGQSVYSASKAGLFGFSASLAREVASRGIRVNTIAPGFIETDMTAGLSEARRAEIIERIPLGRFGTSEEVAAMALFLMDAEYITGQTFVVDGGLSSAA